MRGNALCALGCGVVFALTVGANSSLGAINRFSTRAAFNAAAVTINANEDFASFTEDAPFRTSTVAANGFTLSQEGRDDGFRNQVDVPPFIFMNVGNGSNHATMYVNFPESTLVATNVRISFPVAASAFGADFYNVGGGEGVVLDVIVNDAVAATFSVNTGFVGVVSAGGERIDSVLLRAATLDPGTGGEGFEMDNAAVRFVPDPATLTSLLPLTAFARGRRRVRAIRSIYTP